MKKNVIVFSVVLIFILFNTFLYFLGFVDKTANSLAVFDFVSHGWRTLFLHKTINFHVIFSLVGAIIAKTFKVFPDEHRGY